MPPRRAPLWPPLALAAALALGPAPARAQATAEDKAAAESLFRRAVALMEREETAEACRLFEEVVRITSGLGAQFELAKCYEQSGRVASAWALYREVAQRDRGRRAKDARAAADRLEPGLAHLTVEVPAAVAAQRGLEVRRDGKPLLRDVWGVAIALDPGDHRLEASAGGAHWAAQITLAQGGSRSVIVGPLVEAAPPAPAAPAPAPAAAPAPAPLRAGAGPGEAASAPGHTQRVVGLSVAGLGLVGLGVGVAFGLEAKASYQKQRDDKTCDDDATCTPEGDRASRDARARGDLGTAVGGVGLGALVGGFVLYLTAPSARAGAPKASAHGAPAPKAAALEWRPSVGPRAATLDVALRW